MWIVDSSLTYLQKFCVNVLKCGRIPNHIAIIMDGNRRFARKSNLNRSDGHAKGFDKLAETLQWCRELGVREVTVYAFSIENFKRGQDEVDTLLRLATEKFAELLNERERIMREGVCVRVIGNLTLLPPELRRLIAEAMLMTKDNTAAYLNVALAYTSRDEIAHACDTVAQARRAGTVRASDVDETLIAQCLYTGESADPDILVRTSGEVRFSDFLLWQISRSFVCFADVLWPEFCIWHLLYCIFQYQRCVDGLVGTTGDGGLSTSRLGELPSTNDDKVAQFVGDLKRKRFDVLRSYLI